MGYRLTWMPAALSKYGLRVILINGWQTRGHGNVSNTTGVLGHHTAGAAKLELPSKNILIDGRSDLPGPLCNLALGRSGTVYVVAAGLAYHAGSGSLFYAPSSSGNNHLIGIEAESTGHGDWTTQQKIAYPKMAAALLDYLGLKEDRFAFHKNYAPSRKIDAAGWPGDITGFRNSIKQELEKAHRPKLPTPIMPKPGETLREGNSGGKVVWLQNQLNADLQHPPGIHVTGHFDIATRHAVARFQLEQPQLRDFGHNPKLAGLAGPKTIQRLKEYKD